MVSFYHKGSQKQLDRNKTVLSATTNNCVRMPGEHNRNQVHNKGYTQDGRDQALTEVDVVHNSGKVPDNNLPVPDKPQALGRQLVAERE